MNRNYTKQNPNFLIQSNESTLKFIRFNLSFLTTCGLVVCARYDLAYASCIFKNQDPSFSKTKWQPPLLRQSGSLSLIFRKKKKKNLCMAFAFPSFYHLASSHQTGMQLLALLPSARYMLSIPPMFQSPTDVDALSSSTHVHF